MYVVNAFTLAHCIVKKIARSPSNVYFIFGIMIKEDILKCVVLEVTLYSMYQEKYVRNEGNESQS